MHSSENKPTLQMWDDRYRNPEYAYGKEPNLFFREQLKKISPGSILMPADGEGRNGVFAAQLGWKVTSFDLSSEGKTKALALAEEKNVLLDYRVGALEDLHLPDNAFDAIGLIYAHVAAEKKTSFHRQLQRHLKPGGVILLEAFSKKHLQLVQANPKVGGPKDPGMLLSLDEIRSDFKYCDMILLEELEIQLQEGSFHNGKGSVVRFIGIKQSDSDK